MTGIEKVVFPIMDFLPSLIGIAFVVAVVGILFYITRRRIRSQFEAGHDEPEVETMHPAVKMDVTPVNDPGPHLTQEPAITSETIAAPSTPVSEVKPASKRTVKKAAADPKKESKPAKKEQKSQKAPKVTKDTKGKTAGKKSGKNPVKTEKKTVKSTKATKPADEGEVNIVVKTPAKKSSKKST